MASFSTHLGSAGPSANLIIVSLQGDSLGFMDFTGISLGLLAFQKPWEARSLRQAHFLCQCYVSVMLLSIHLVNCGTKLELDFF